MALEIDKEEITIYLNPTSLEDQQADYDDYLAGLGEEDEAVAFLPEVNEDIFTVSILNLPKGVDNELIVDQTSLGIINVEKTEKDDDENTTTYTVSALKIGRTQLIVKTLEGNREQTIDIEVIEKIEGLYANEYYTPVGLLGQSTIINTTSALKFFPTTTSQKDIRYELVGEYAGVTVSSAGEITAGDTYSGYVIVRATSIHNETLTADLDVRIVQPIDVDNVLLQFEGHAVEEVVLATNKIEESQGNYSVYVLENSETLNTTITADNKRKIEAEQIDSDDYLLRSIELGNTFITVRVSLAGYAEHFVEKVYPVRIIEYPEYVKINGTSGILNNQEIFDRYVNVLGQPFIFEVGAVGCYDKTMKINIEPEDREKIQLSYSDGSLVNMENDIIPSGIDIYIKAIEDSETGEVNGQVNVTVVALGSPDENNPVTSIVNLNLSKGADNINMLTETNMIIKRGSSQQLQFEAVPASSSLGEITILDSNKGVVQITSINGSTTNYNVDGINVGTTKLVLVSANGINQIIDIEVYEELDGFTINMYSPEENSDIALNETEDVVIGSETRETLDDIIIAIGSVLPTNINAYPEGADIVSVSYESSNILVATVSSSGSISAKAEGLSVITAYVTKKVEGSEPVILSRTFNLNVYVPISGTQLNYYQYELLDSQSLGYFDMESSELQLELNVSPSASTFSSEDAIWHSSNNYATVTPEGLVNATLPPEIEFATTTITALLQENDRYYTQKCVINIKRAVRVEDVSILNVIENRIYFDARNGLGEANAGQNSFKIDAQVYPLSSHNQAIKYIYEQLPGDNIPLPVVEILEDGTVIPNRAGNAVIYVVARDSYYSESNYTRYSIINIRVADGLSHETAIEISNGQDLVNLNTVEGLSRYYVLSGTIDVTNIELDSIGIIDSTVNGFTGELSGNYDYFGETTKNQIIGLSVSMDKTSRTNYIGLIALLEGGTVKDLKLKINLYDIKLQSNIDHTVSYIGGLVAYNDGGIIDNVVVEIVSSDIELANLNNYVGVIAGYNDGQITDSQAKGKLYVLEKLSAFNTPNIYVGGIAGFNEDTVSGNFDVTNNTLIENPSNMNSLVEIKCFIGEDTNNAYGGLVGFNVGSISNISSDALVEGKYNTGGAVGINEGTLNNVFVSGFVTGTNNVGGLVGYSSGGTITRSIMIMLDRFEIDEVVLPQIKGINNIGGLVGYSSGGTISYSYANTFYSRTLDKVNYSGDIYVEIPAGYTDDVYVGGLVGYSEALNITYSFADLNIVIIDDDLTNVNVYSGSILGANNGLLYFNNLYAKGSIDSGGTSYVSGVIGNLSSEFAGANYISTIYTMTTLAGANTGSIIASATTGLGSNTIGSCIYVEATLDDETEGSEHTSAELIQLSTYINEGFVFAGDATWTHNSNKNEATPYIKYDATNQMLIEAPDSLTVTIANGIVLSNEIAHNHFKISDTQAVLYYYESGINDLNIYSLDDSSLDYGSPIIDKAFIPSDNNFNWVGFTSFNKDVLTINKDGVLEVLSTGTAIIRIYSILDKNVYDEIEIAVILPASNFNIYVENEDKTDFEELVDNSDILTINKDELIRLYPSLQAIVDGVEFDYNAQIDVNYGVSATVPGVSFEGSEWSLINTIQQARINIDEAQVIKGDFTDSGLITITPIIYVDFGGGQELLSFDFMQKQFVINVVEGSTVLELDSYESSVSLKDIYVIKVDLTTDIPAESVIAIESVERTGAEPTDDPVSELRIESLFSTEEDGIITEYFEIEVNDKYDEKYKQNQIYTIKFASYDSSTAGVPDEGEPAILQQTLVLNIVPQDVFRIDMNFYSSNEVIQDESGVHYNPNELPSTSIQSGKTGILKLGIYPEFSDIDFVDLKYATNSDFTISFDQVVFEGISYTTVYPQSEIIENGIRLRLDNLNGQTFEGDLFARLLIGSGVSAETVFTVYATAYSINEFGEVIEGLTGSTALTAKPASTVEVLYEGQATGYIPVGVTKTVMVNVTKMQEDHVVVWNNTNDDDLTINYINEVKIDYIIYKQYEIMLDSSAFTTPADYQKLITLQAVVEQTVNNKLEQYRSNVFNVVPTLFTINSIEVRDVVASELIVAYGGTYELVIEIEADYEDKEIGNAVIEAEIEILEEIFSKSIYSWYKREHTADGNSDENMVLNINYGNYILLQDEEMYIQPKRVSTGDYVAAKVQFIYNYEDALYEGIPIENLTDLFDIKEGIDVYSYRTIETEFRTNFYLKSSYENPIPIYNEDGIIGMQDGASYILMNDITIGENSPWTPIMTDIKSLDGNDKTVTIVEFNHVKSGEDVESVDSAINLGLFGAIDIGTIIKNLTVELTNIEVDASRYSYVNVGGIVANNNGGTIYNCHTFNSTTTSDKGLTVILNSEVAGDSINIYIGGVVAKNSGYITNSSSSLEIETDQGYVAGIVSYNSGTISSSYYNEGLIKNYAQTKVSSAVGGAVVYNSETGEIKYTYVHGKKGLTDSDRLTSGGIIFGGDIGGFIYENRGIILDSYSNIKITSQGRSAGFVFDNYGLIENSFSLSEVAYNVAAHTPFVGTDEQGIPRNDGDIDYCYYLEGAFAGKDLELASELSLAEFSTKDVFSTYSFATGIVDDYAIWKMYDYVGQNGSVTLPYLVGTNQIVHSRQILSKQVIDEDTGETEYTYTYELGYTEGSYNNPYIIEDENKFNLIINNGTGVFTGHARLINDIVFDTGQAVETSVVDFKGILDGNGMEMSNISVISSNETSSNAIGIFKTISGDGVVKNIDLQIDEVFANDTVNVGVLAGVIYNGKVYNIKIDGEETVVQGRNNVGGVAGKIIGDTDLINVEVNISVNSTFREDVNILVPYTLYDNNHDLYTDANANGIYDEGETLVVDYNENGSFDATEQLISYGGAIAGVVDQSSGIVQYARVRNNSSIIAETAGGAFGLVGTNSKVENILVEVVYNQFIRSTKVAGGVIGENRGEASNILIRHKKLLQTYIDDNYFAGNYGEIYNSQNISLFAGQGQVAGGIVGFNNGGDLSDSLSKIDVRNSSVEIAGGIIGRMTGGSIDNCIAYGSLLAEDAIGGIIGAVTEREILSTEAGSLISYVSYDVISSANPTISNCAGYNNYLKMDYDEINNGDLVVGGIIGAIQLTDFNSTFTSHEKAGNIYINSIYNPYIFEEDDDWYIINEYGTIKDGTTIDYLEAKNMYLTTYDYDYMADDADADTYDNPTNTLGYGINIFDATLDRNEDNIYLGSAAPPVEDPDPDPDPPADPPADPSEHPTKPQIM
jgi:hypothetical protein